MSRHRNHRMHSNSLAAHDPIGMSGRRAAIYAWLKENGPATDRQIMQALGLPDPNCVRPRVTELVDASILAEVDSVRDPVTGIRVRRTHVASKVRESQTL